MKFLLIFFFGLTAHANNLANLAHAILPNDAPRWLSDMRAFQNLTDLKPNEDFLPYELNVPFWSDGASEGTDQAQFPRHTALRACQPSDFPKPPDQ